MKRFFKSSMSFIVIFIALIISCNVTFAEDKSNPENYTKNLLLPINHTNNEMISLSVAIPKEFIGLQQLESLFKNGILEYVPNGQTGQNWDEIITVQMLKGKRVQAKQMTDLFKEHFSKNAINTKVLKEKSTNENGYNKSTLLMSYTYNTRNELIFIEYYSGPYDIAGVQYAVNIKDDKDMDKLKEKIEDYFHKNVTITK